MTNDRLAFVLNVSVILPANEALLLNTAAFVNVVLGPPNVTLFEPSIDMPTEVVSAVPPEFITTTLPAAPAPSVGSSAKPAVMASYSARIVAELPVEPVAGALPWL
jgi:hypothetical protein